jgi:hypothetical protein
MPAARPQLKDCKRGFPRAEDKVPEAMESGVIWLLLLLLLLLLLGLRLTLLLSIWTWAGRNENTKNQRDQQQNWIKSKFLLICTADTISPSFFVHMTVKVKCGIYKLMRSECSLLRPRVCEIGSPGSQLKAPTANLHQTDRCRPCYLHQGTIQVLRVGPQNSR